jgi:hypothetical protein
MVKIDDGVMWPKPLFDFLPGYNLPTAFNEHLQNPKGLLPKKGFVVVANCSRRVERTRMEVDLEGSEPDTTYTLILNRHLELWTEARCRAEPPSQKANHAKASSRRAGLCHLKNQSLPRDSTTNDPK